MTRLGGGVRQGGVVDRMHDKSLATRVLKAARSGDVESLQLLGVMPTGAAPGAGLSPSQCMDDTGAGPIHYAARAGKLDALRYLVKECGLVAHGTTKVGATPAHDAAATGQLDCLRWLLETTACDMEDRDEAGATVVHLAARYGHLRCLKWLVVDAGASLQVKCKTGALPLHFAAANGHLDTVKFLVEQRPG